MESKNFKFQSIAFFYPSKLVGGAEFLFLRLAAQLSKNTDIPIAYIDYSDGFAAGQIKEQGLDIQLIPFNGFSTITVANNTVVVAPLSSVIDLLAYLRGTYHIFLWSTHPLGLKNTLDIHQKFTLKKWSDAQFGEDLDGFIQARALAFMDGSNWDAQRDIFKLKQDTSNFLPIFCLPRESSGSPSHSRAIRLGCLGRLSTEKVYPLVNLIEHAIVYLDQNPNQTAEIHIIGEGDARYLIEEIALPDSLKIVWVGTLLAAQLADYLSAHVQVVFAMGTSALETASLGIPTVLFDLSYHKMPLNNRFRWLSESTRYSVGDLYHPERVYAHSFEDIVELILRGDLHHQAQQSAAYVAKNHSLEQVASQFLSEVQKTTLDARALEKTKFAGFKLISLLRRLRKALGV